MRSPARAEHIGSLKRSEALLRKRADFSLGQCTAWALTAYAYKFCIAILMTPVVYLIHWVAERYLGREKAAEMKVAAMKGY